MRSIAISVCLSACVHISKTRCPNFTKFSVHVVYGHESVLLWQRCDVLRTSGFLDDVMFTPNGQAHAGDVKRTYVQNHSPDGSTIWPRVQRISPCAAPGAKYDVYSYLIHCSTSLNFPSTPKVGGPLSLRSENLWGSLGIMGAGFFKF